MYIKVVGKRHVTFTGTDGNQITGDTYYFLYSDQQVEGFAPDKCFVRTGRPVPFRVNGEYQVSYMRNGKIDLDNIQDA